MKTLIKLLAVVGVLGGIGVAVYGPAKKYLEDRNRTQWRTQNVSKGDIAQTVNSTGKVEPIHRVSVGASVSGPISELFVDYNTKVVEGQLLARIDPRLYKSTVERDRAQLLTRQAEVARSEAQQQQAVNDERRGGELKRGNRDFISEAELDGFRFIRMSRDAELLVAKANVDQAKAQLDNSLANLGYTDILSPCEGVVIEKKIDIGQTLAAQFQTPEMFVVAPEMDQRMHIYASVDEADIGMIRKAQVDGQVVRFTVDAYPEELFDQGKIVQVRLSSTEEQNVITYPVIVETPNTDLKLLPGMTANLSFQIKKREGIIRVPNAALRFYPAREKVHPDDRKIIDGVDEQKQIVTDTAKQLSADEKAEATRSQNRRHVWVAEGNFLRGKPVVTGISDNRYTELVDGDVSEKDELVVGEKPKT
ncbi:MAG: efflux RND transporter periplasmic adaptor subunit [Planctomycetota bacterium]|nr:efflux RND transporter periplasmic adaptor subunit [Planctomycetota bacterium]